MNQPTPTGTKRGRGRPASFDREAALDRAVELFWKHGYEGASIALLTDAMGVTPPTLYAAFGSKEALYGEALARYRRREAQAAAPPQAGDTLFDLVERFLRDAAQRFAAPGGPRGCMVAVGFLQCGPEGQAAAGAAAAARAEGLALFVAAVDAARARGELPSGVDGAALARFYSAVVEGMAVQAIDGADAAQLDAVVDFALAAWPVKR